jgi:hypothetical protein
MKKLRAVISGFRRDVDICALLGHFAASNIKPLPTFRDNTSVPSLLAFLILEDGPDTLSRNLGKCLPFDAA